MKTPAAQDSAVPMWKRALASLLVLCLVWSVSPAVYAASESSLPAFNQSRQGRAGLAPANRLPLAVELNLRLSSAQGQGQGALLQSIETLSSPQATPVEKAAARAILGTLLRRESFLPRLKAELGEIKDPAHSSLAAQAVERLSRLEAPTAEALAKAEAGLEAGIPAALDDLYDDQEELPAASAPYSDALPASGSGAGEAQALRLSPSNGAKGEIPQALRNIESFYKPTAPAEVKKEDLSPADETKPDEAASKDPIKVDFGSWVRNLSPRTLISRILSLGHFNSFKKEIRKVVNKLAIPGDNPDYSARILPNVDPNAAIEPEKASMYIHLGLLSYTKNEDEFAAVIAHEMTHANKDQLKALADDKETEGFLESLEGYKNLKADQREEMRADLGALDRLIDAGYNPWAAYHFEKRIAQLQSRLFDLKILKFLFKFLFRKSFDYLEAHPSSEIRMAAAKAYILRRGYQEDMTEVTQREHKLPISISLLRYRILPLTTLMVSPWTWRFLIAKFSLDLGLWLVGLFSPKTAKSLDHAGSSAWQGAKDHVLKPVWDHTLAPIWTHALSPAWEAISGAVVWLWNKAWIPWEHFFPGIDRGDAMMLAVGLIAVPTFLALLYHVVISVDKAAYKNLIKVRRGAKRLRARLSRESPAGLSDGKLIGLIRGSRKNLEIINDLYQKASNIYIFRYLDGLSLARIRWLKLHNKIMEELVRRLRAMTEEGRLSSRLALEFNLEGIPPYAIEHPKAGRLIEEAAALAGKKIPEDHPLALYRSAVLWPADAPPGPVLALARLLMEAGLMDTARRLFDRHYHRALDFVLSSQNNDPELVQAWIKSEKALRVKRTLLRVNYRDRSWRDDKLLWARLKRIGRGLPDQMAIVGISQEIRPATLQYLSLRHWLGKLDALLIRLRISWSFNSAAGLKDFVEDELRPRNVLLDHFSPTFHRVLLKHPEWIRTPEDLQALISEEAFWPKLGSNPAGFLEEMLVQAVRNFSERYPDQWKYEPASSEKLHELYLRKLGEFGLAPKDFTGRLELWKRLTSRGVTSATDSMFEELYREADESAKEELESLALKGLIWDQPLKAQIVERQVKASPEYQALLSGQNPNQRLKLLKKVIRMVRKGYPEHGIHYVRILEDISREMQSGPKESSYIHESKKPRGGGEKAEDFSLRFLSHLTSEALSWRKSQQWALIQYLRGDIPPNRKIRKAFRTVGPERVRRFFEILPLAARTALLDQFLDSPKGLANKVDVKSGYPKKIIDHVLPKGDPEARRSAHDILEAFLYSLEKTGNQGFQSYILAYMLSLPKDETASVGKTLKGVLEIFGASGVKIGQFLAASQLLPEEETKVLRQLQERALVPDREDIYADLREITGRRDFPFTVKELLGAASIKYAFLAKENKTREPVVLKVFRLSALAHTPLEFQELDHMARYLYRKNGGRYGVFRSIVKAAKRAVERELSSANEVDRSQIAREKIYAGHGEEGALVWAPHEQLISERLVASEYAPGKSIYDLKPELQALAGRKILQMEGDILFADQDLIHFDPDRHPGNYRISAQESAFGPSLSIHPIDQGQGLALSRADRERIFDLFALSQIMRETGSTNWAVRQAAGILGLDDKASRKLKSALARYFPAAMEPVAAYYSLLAALDDSGREMDTAYFDFVRGLVQLKQYEELAPGFSPTPRRRLETIVSDRARAMSRTLELSSWEKARIAWYRLRRDVEEKPPVKWTLNVVRSGIFRRLARVAAATAIVLLAASPFKPEIADAAEKAYSWTVRTMDDIHWPWTGTETQVRKEAASRGRLADHYLEEVLKEADEGRAFAAAKILVERVNAGLADPNQALSALAYEISYGPSYRRWQIASRLMDIRPSSYGELVPESLIQAFKDVIISVNDAELSQRVAMRWLYLVTTERTNHVRFREELEFYSVAYSIGSQTKGTFRLILTILRNWEKEHEEKARSKRLDYNETIHDPQAKPDQMRAAIDGYLRQVELGDLPLEELGYRFDDWLSSLPAEKKIVLLQELRRVPPQFYGAIVLSVPTMIGLLENADSRVRLESARTLAGLVNHGRLAPFKLESALRKALLSEPNPENRAAFLKLIEEL